MRIRARSMSTYGWSAAGAEAVCVCICVRAAARQRLLVTRAPCGVHACAARSAQSRCNQRVGARRGAGYLEERRRLEHRGQRAVLGHLAVGAARAHHPVRPACAKGRRAWCSRCAPLQMTLWSFRRTSKFFTTTVRGRRERGDAGSARWAAQHGASWRSSRCCTWRGATTRTLDLRCPRA